MKQSIWTWILWIIVFVWRFLSRVVDVIGKKATYVVGTGLIVLGLFLSFTIIGAILGIPIILFGAMLIAAALLKRKKGLSR